MSEEFHLSLFRPPMVNPLSVADRPYRAQARRYALQPTKLALSQIFIHGFRLIIILAEEFVSLL